MIEFIGVSGVGKSTLALKIQSSLKRRRAGNIPVFFKENPDTSTGFPDSELGSIYLELFRMKMDNQMNRFDLSSFDKIKTSEWLAVNLNQDAFLCASARGVYFRDDGLFHAFHDEIVELWHRDGFLPPQLLANRAFIFCEGDPRAIVNRVLEREARGQSRPWARAKNEVELLKKVEEMAAGRREIISQISAQTDSWVLFDTVTEQGIEALTRWVEKFLIGTKSIS